MGAKVSDECEKRCEESERYYNDVQAMSKWII